jgi:ABC-type lipoprotein release transport system permease subunit
MANALVHRRNPGARRRHAIVPRSILTRTVTLTLFFSLSLCVFAVSEPEILVNQRLAETLSLRAGDFVEISASGEMKDSRRFRVAAIYEEKADPSQVPLRRSLVKMHLPDLEQVTGKKDQLDLISIQLRKKIDTSRMAARLNGESIGFTAYSAQELARRSSTTFQVVSRFHRAIAFITMVAGAIFIFALMIMRVEDQRKNLAMLTIIGVSRSTILKTLLIESTFFAFFAIMLGAGLGHVASALVNIYYQHYYQTNLIFAHVSPNILFEAVSISFVLGMIAGTFSWFRLRRLAVLEELGR